MASTPWIWSIMIRFFRAMIRCHHFNGPYADEEKMPSCAMNVSGTPLAEGARQTSRQSFVTASGVVRISLWHKKAFDVIQILVVTSKSLCNHKQHSRKCKLQIQYDNIPTSLAQVWFYQGFLPTFGYVWHIPLIILTLKSLNRWCQRKLPGVQSRFSPDMKTKIPLAIRKGEARRSKSPLILIFFNLERESKHNTSWGE